MRYNPRTMTLAETHRNHLHTLPLFSQMTPATRARISGQMSARPYARDESLITAGDTDQVLMILLSGQVAVQVREGSRVWTLARLSTGALLGEIGFFEAFPVRTADVVGLTAGVAATLDRAVYHSFRTEDAAALEMAVLDALAERLTETNTGISTLLARTASATWLADLRGWLGRIGRR